MLIVFVEGGESRKEGCCIDGEFKQQALDRGCCWRQ